MRRLRDLRRIFLFLAASLSALSAGPVRPASSREKSLAVLAVRDHAVRPPISARRPALPTASLSALDNGVVRIGIDLDEGGSITYFAESASLINVVNDHDYGRQIQQSYYAGPAPYRNPAWPNWPWNPIGTGDLYGHAGRVLASRNDGTTLYVKTLPLQWALNAVPCECTMETWITLDGRAARVRNRLTNDRADTTQYPPLAQELPAVYTIGKLYRLFTYSGNAPYTGGALREIPPRWPGIWYRGEEHWMAYVDDQDWGLGIYAPEIFTFAAAFWSTPNTGGPRDDPTGYVSPTRLDILDHDIVYEYEYWLILDRLSGIRTWVQDHHLPDAPPDYQFRNTGSRQHVTYVNAKDDGVPRENGLRIEAEQGDPQISGPEQWWDASLMPVVHVCGAFHTQSPQAEFFWSLPGQDMSADRRVGFFIQPDGEFHRYAVNLAAHPLYRGTISGLRFDPMNPGAAGDFVDVAFISYKDGPCSATPIPTRTPTPTRTPLPTAPPAVGATFFSLDPCRLIDTRGEAGPRGGPALAAGFTRALPAAGECGIPFPARAISVNVTVTAPATTGFVTLFPSGSARPSSATIHYARGQARANGTVLLLGPTGAVSAFCGQPSGAVQLIVDVNGYFE
jgi:hypothetical protein